MLFKACQRCAGDLRETSDMYGRYMQCIQCGNVVDIPTEPLGTVKSDAVAVDDQSPAAA